MEKNTKFIQIMMMVEVGDGDGDDNGYKTFQFHCQCTIWWNSRPVSALWSSTQVKSHSPHEFTMMMMMMTMTMKTTTIMMECHLTKAGLTKHVTGKDDMRKHQEVK